MDKLLARLRADYPQLRFEPGTTFSWSPASSVITYPKVPRDHSTVTAAAFSLLHETGHALLDHQRYALDYELLQLEAAAWERARTLAAAYDIALDDDHVQDCLDSYRDWLYRRSICPSCTTKALQLDGQTIYQCYNCRATWQVSGDRFCRPYRHKRGQAAPVFASSLI
jgi:hypothetical protein